MVKSAHPSAREATPRRLVERACVVCEWKGEVSEAPGEAVQCPWCYAPTDLIRVISGADPRIGSKNPHAAALGRLGGLKGGRARANRLSATRRREIARKAARARWRKQKA